MPYIQGDIPTTISVTNLIVEYLENSDDVVLPQRVESIILQNVLQWLQSEHIDTYRYKMECYTHSSRYVS